MKITVLYFAAAREATGCSEERLEVEAGCTADALFLQLARPPRVGARYRRPQRHE